MNAIKANRDLRALHSDPRWAAFLRKMNLPVDDAEGMATPTTTVPPSIAVLPFADMSPKHDQDYFADGVAEEIRMALARVAGLKVIGRSSSTYFKGKADDLQAIGRKLGVANVLEGSLRTDGNAVRVTAQLVRVADGAQLWSERYDGKLTAIFKVQDEIARAVVGGLKVKLLPGAAIGRPSARVVNPEAYRLFLLGRAIGSQGTAESQRRSIETLERALQIDPGLARAHVLIAIGLNNLAQEAVDSAGAEARRLRQRSREEVQRAIGLDPGEASAYAARAFQRMLDWDWKGAGQDLDRAEGLDPADEVVLTIRGIHLSFTGKYDEAVVLARSAFEKEPLSAIFAGNLAVALRRAGRLDEARDMWKRSQEIAPGSGAALREQALIDLMTGRADAALAGFRRVQPRQDRLMGVALASHALGREKESFAALSELERDYGAEWLRIAGVRAYRGDRDGAMVLLEKAWDRHDPDLVWLKSWWSLRPLRDDPRFIALLRKMNLPVD